MKLKVIFFFAIIFLCSCVETLPDEELTMVRTSYTGTKIRLDGCYVSRVDKNTNECQYRFFYSNGVSFCFYDRLGVRSISQVTSNLNNYRNDKHYWEIYLIQNDTLHTQGWRQIGSGFFSVSQNVLDDNYYKIINDTTLYIEYSSGYKEFYDFVKFSPKPDSTNTFIK